MLHGCPLSLGAWGRLNVVTPFHHLSEDCHTICPLGARPITDAMPFLRRAGLIEVVIVSNEPGKKDQIERVDISAHLARHGLNVVVKRMPFGDVDVTAMLLSHAADEDVDFIVMGGYGHSRLRELVLGGVTRSMLRSMTVPVLMSH